MERVKFNPRRPQIPYPIITKIFKGDYVGGSDARTDFHAKYLKRRGFAQGCAFWGFRNHSLTFRPLFSQKTAIFGPHFDGT